MRAGTNQPFAPKQGEDGMVDLDPVEEVTLDPETDELVTKRFVEFLTAQACPTDSPMQSPAVPCTVHGRCDPLPREL